MPIPSLVSHLLPLFSRTLPCLATHCPLRFAPWFAVFAMVGHLLIFFCPPIALLTRFTHGSSPLDPKSRYPVTKTLLSHPLPAKVCPLVRNILPISSCTLPCLAIHCPLRFAPWFAVFAMVGHLLLFLSTHCPAYPCYPRFIPS